MKTRSTQWNFKANRLKWKWDVAIVADWGEVAHRVADKLPKGGAAFPKNGIKHGILSALCLQFANFPCIPEMPLPKPSPNDFSDCRYMVLAVMTVDVIKQFLRQIFEKFPAPWAHCLGIIRPQRWPTGVRKPLIH